MRTAGLRLTSRALLVGTALSFGLTQTARAQTDTSVRTVDTPGHDAPPKTVLADEANTIIVYGRAINLIGIAQSGSQGTVGYKDFENRPLSRVGELVENVPGLIATQHSGSGKANQYFLRGFNLDHGTDLGSGLIGHSQKMTVAARATAEKKTVGHRS